MSTATARGVGTSAGRSRRPATTVRTGWQRAHRSLTSCRGPRPARRTPTLAVTAVLVTLLTACGTGNNAVDTRSKGQYRFVNATAQGSVIPVAARKPAGPLTGSLITGGRYQLASAKGSVVLINYWASWCAPCVTESPMLNTVSGLFKARGVDFVGIDVKDERQAAQSFITDNRMSYPMVYDESAKTALQLAIPAGGLPVTILVDRAGRVAAVYLGAVQRSTITASLQRLAAETP